MAAHQPFQKPACEFEPHVQFKHESFACPICGVVPIAKMQMPCGRVEHELCRECCQKSFRDNEFGCQFCQINFPSHNPRRLPESLVHNTMLGLCVMQCQFCGFSGNPYAMDRHQWECPSFPMECTLCGKNGIKRSEMEKHMTDSADLHMKELAEKAKVAADKTRKRHENAIKLTFLEMQDKAASGEEAIDKYHRYKEATESHIKESVKLMIQESDVMIASQRQEMEALQKQHDRNLMFVQFKHSSKLFASSWYREWMETVVKMNEAAHYMNDVLADHALKLQEEEEEMAVLFMREIENIVKLSAEISQKEFTSITSKEIFAEAVQRLADFQNPRSHTVHDLVAEGNTIDTLPRAPQHTEGEHDVEKLAENMREQLRKVQLIDRMTMHNFMQGSIPILEALRNFLRSGEDLPPKFKSSYAGMLSTLDWAKGHMRGFFLSVPDMPEEVIENRNKFRIMFAELSILLEMELPSENNWYWDFARFQVWDEITNFMSENNLVGRFKDYQVQESEQQSKRQRTHVVGGSV